MSPKEARAKAALILFDLTATLEPRVKPLRQWFFDSVKLTERWFEAEGNQGVKRMKDCLSYAWETVLGQKPVPLSFVQSSRTGCPDVVDALVKRASSCIKDVRMMSAVQTLVRLVDLWEGVPETRVVAKSLEIIRNSSLPGTARREIENFEKFVPLFFAAYPDHPLTKAFDASIRLDESDGYLYRQTKGPNGPLIAAAHKDWLALESFELKNGKTLLEEVITLQDHVASFCDFSFGSKDHLGQAIRDYGIDRLKESVPYRRSPGKLSLKPEKGGKVRIVAQPDYFTQLTLRPVHNWLMGMLRAIPCDYTHDQKAAIPQICKWQSEGDGFTASFDQSACTDRFPFEYQLKVISGRFGVPMMESFRAVVSDRTWEVKLPDGKVRTIRWSIGQPLGMYGSWPLMAVTHHLLVQYCYWITRGRTFRKHDFFQKYAICGDDIVIADRAVARQYQLLCKRLGLVVNEAKSHISGGDTGVPPVSEFAKVTIWRGSPLTPIKPKMVLSAVLDSRNAIPLFADLASSRTWAVRRRFIELVIRKYFPREKSFLTSLLTIPREFGGLGFRDDRSIRRLFGDLKTDQIHPLIYYIADRVRTAMKKERAALASSESLAESIPPELFRQHPLMEYLRAKTSELTQAHYAFGDGVPSHLEIVASLVLNGFQGFSYLLTDDVLPDYPFSADQNDRQVTTSWHRALSKEHIFSKPKGYPSIIPGLEDFLQSDRETAFKRLTEDPDWFIQRQLEVIASFLLAKRSILREKDA